MIKRSAIVGGASSVEGPTEANQRLSGEMQASAPSLAVNQPSSRKEPEASSELPSKRVREEVCGCRWVWQLKSAPVPDGGGRWVLWSACWLHRR